MTKTELKPFMGYDPAVSNDTTTLLIGYSKDGVVHICALVEEEHAENLYAAWNTRPDNSTDGALGNLIREMENAITDLKQLGLGTIPAIWGDLKAALQKPEQMSSLEKEIRDKRIWRIGLAISKMNYWERLWWALTGKHKYMTHEYWEEYR